MIIELNTMKFSVIWGAYDFINFSSTEPRVCISKQQGEIQIKLEDDNKDLKAILQEVRIITDKFRDEVRLAKYNSGKVELSSIY